jgi:hypothetical protein
MLIYLRILTIAVFSKFTNGNLNPQCTKQEDNCGEPFHNVYVQLSDNDIDTKASEILVFTVASEPTDGFKRYLASARHNHIAPTSWASGKNGKVALTSRTYPEVGGRSTS